MLNVYLENIKIALSSLKLNKVRSFLTVLGTTIGVFAVIMIIAIVTGLKDEIRGQIVSLGADILDIVPSNTDNLGPGSSAIFASFKKSEVTKLRERKDLYRYFSELYSVGATYRYQNKEKNGYAIGVHPDYFKLRGNDSVAGEMFQSKDYKSRSRVVVVGLNVAESMYQSPERSIGRTLQINGADFSIVGVMEKQDIKFGAFDIDDAVYIPGTSAESTFEDARITDIFVSVPDESRLAEYKAGWEKALRKIRKGDDFTVLAQEDLLGMVDKIMAMITTALAGLASISLLVGGIGIMNIMLVSVTERTQEIGIRKAIGAEDQHILLQFLTESVVLSILGGLIGLLLAEGISLVLERGFGISSLINLKTVVGAVGFSVLVGVVFGTMPAYKASKKDPIEALRYNQ